ncbi:hypothetical protein PybrP1_006442 [[Pythium] brassicae (nom. inval.)]|nr:hypothetical protein PybrP1_006442 [[Pythium] brassicae (nom. inval.)]
MPPTSTFGDTAQLKETPLAPPTLTAEDVAAFSMMAERVEMRYLEVETVFRAAGLADCRTNVRDAALDACSDGGVRLKFTTSRLFPFAVQTIHEMASRIGKAQHTTGPGHVRWSRLSGCLPGWVDGELTLSD